jgi:hypothetical protein
MDSTLFRFEQSLRWQPQGDEVLTKFLEWVFFERDKQEASVRIVVYRAASA